MKIIVITDAINVEQFDSRQEVMNPDDFFNYLDEVSNIAKEVSKIYVDETALANYDIVMIYQLEDLELYYHLDITYYNAHSDIIHREGIFFADKLKINANHTYNETIPLNIREEICHNKLAYLSVNELEDIICNKITLSDKYKTIYILKSQPLNEEHQELLDLIVKKHNLVVKEI